MAQETGNYYTDIFSPDELSNVTTLPPFIVSDQGIGGSVFDTFDPFGYGSMATLQPVIPSGGGEVIGGLPSSNAATPLPSSGKEPWTNIYNEELARLNSINAQKGLPPVSLSDKAPGSDQTVGEYLIQKADSGLQWETDVQASNAAAAARSSSGQTGIPLVLPLPIDPVTGAIITAAGLIASRGNIAKLDPTDPVGSIINAGKGTLGTITSIPGQIGSAISDVGGIFSGPTAPGAPEPGAGLPQATGIAVGAGALGGQSQSGASSTVTPGALGGAPSGIDTPTGSLSSASGSPIAVGVGPMAPAGEMPADERRKMLEQVMSGVGAAGTQISNQAEEEKARQSVLDAMSNVGQQPAMDPAQLRNVMGTILGGVTTAQQAERQAALDAAAALSNQTVFDVPTTSTTDTQVKTGGTDSTTSNVSNVIVGVPGTGKVEEPTINNVITGTPGTGKVEEPNVSNVITGTPGTGKVNEVSTDTSNVITGTPVTGTGETTNTNTTDVITGVTRPPKTDTTNVNTSNVITGTPVTGNLSGTEDTNTTNVFTGTPVSGKITGTTVSASFPLIYGTSSPTYKPMATTVAQRNLPSELSTSTSALFGQIPLVNAAGQPTGGTTNLMDQYTGMYQNLLGQTMLGNVKQPGLTSQIGQQLAADQAKLQRIQAGQLAPEDVRNAQQAAREAYGARGQVMGPGAIGAEILNREAIRQQRENEARAGYQSSMQNALNATQLQTGNIFSPIGSLVSGTFNPLAPYEADVYGTNVNALNAEQIAAANRQAALDAAKMGQTGAYAQTLGTFLGSPTGQSGIQSLVDWLMGKKSTPGT